MPGQADDLPLGQGIAATSSPDEQAPARSRSASPPPSLKAKASASSSSSSPSPLTSANPRQAKNTPLAQPAPAPPTTHTSNDAASSASTSTKPPTRAAGAAASYPGLTTSSGRAATDREGDGPTCPRTPPRRKRRRPSDSTSPPSVIGATHQPKPRATTEESRAENDHDVESCSSADRARAQAKDATSPVGSAAGRSARSNSGAGHSMETDDSVSSRSSRRDSTLSPNITLHQRRSRQDSSSTRSESNGHHSFTNGESASHGSAESASHHDTHDTDSSEAVSRKRGREDSEGVLEEGDDEGDRSWRKLGARGRSAELSEEGHATTGTAAVEVKPAAQQGLEAGDDKLATAGLSAVSSARPLAPSCQDQSSENGDGGQAPRQHAYTNNGDSGRGREHSQSQSSGTSHTSSSANGSRSSGKTSGNATSNSNSSSSSAANSTRNSHSTATHTTTSGSSSSDHVGDEGVSAQRARRDSSSTGSSASGSSSGHSAGRHHPSRSASSSGSGSRSGSASASGSATSSGEDSDSNAGVAPRRAPMAPPAPGGRAVAATTAAGANAGAVGEDDHAGDDRDEAVADAEADADASRAASAPRRGDKPTSARQVSATVQAPAVGVGGKAVTEQPAGSGVAAGGREGKSKKPRKRRNLCICEQVPGATASGLCRQIEVAAGEGFWLNGSMYQLPPPKNMRGDVDVRQRWLYHLGISEEEVKDKGVLKPEVRWAHFPEEAFNSENFPSEDQLSTRRNRRRRLRFTIKRTAGAVDEDVISTGKNKGYAVPTPQAMALYDRAATIRIMHQMDPMGAAAAAAAAGAAAAQGIGVAGFASLQQDAIAQMGTGSLSAEASRVSFPSGMIGINPLSAGQVSLPHGQTPSSFHAIKQEVSGVQGSGLPSTAPHGSMMQLPPFPMSSIPGMQPQHHQLPSQTWADVATQQALQPGQQAASAASNLVQDAHGMALKRERLGDSASSARMASTMFAGTVGGRTNSEQQQQLQQQQPRHQGQQPLRTSFALPGQSGAGASSGIATDATATPGAHLGRTLVSARSSSASGSSSSNASGNLAAGSLVMDPRDNARSATQSPLLASQSTERASSSNQSPGFHGGFAAQPPQAQSMYPLQQQQQQQQQQEPSQAQNAGTNQRPPHQDVQNQHQPGTVPGLMPHLMGQHVHAQLSGSGNVNQVASSTPPLSSNHQQQQLSHQHQQHSTQNPQQLHQQAPQLPWNFSTFVGPNGSQPVLQTTSYSRPWPNSIPAEFPRHQQQYDPSSAPGAGVFGGFYGDLHQGSQQMGYPGPIPLYAPQANDPTYGSQQFGQLSANMLSHGASSGYPVNFISSAQQGFYDATSRNNNLHQHQSHHNPNSGPQG